MRCQRAESPLKLAGFTNARLFFQDCLAESDPDIETLWVAHVDSELRCVHLTHHDGDEGGTPFPLRDIIADAAQHCSAGIVLAHNHPSGDSRPSDADCRATRRLASAAKALDCTVIDHLVFADGECTSFRRIGLL